MATFDYRDFGQVFGKARPFPNRDFFQETETIRRKFEGALFIDRVLKALGVGKGKAHSGSLRSLRQLLPHSYILTNSICNAQLKSTLQRRKTPSRHFTNKFATLT